MHDLLSEGFEPLYPQRLMERNQWGSLWAAFERFVRGTLIPLAKVEVVHPDLRPGFNCTANLLYCDRTKEIRMIDLDSLVDFEVWGLNEPVNHRYISLKRNLGHRTVVTPMDFVFKQVVVIAEAWIQEVPDGNANVNDLFAAHEEAQNWTRDLSQVCDGPFIIKVLKGYRDRFGVRED
jgi:hypothetical protein